MSIITKAELFYGSAKSQTPERSRQKQLEFLQTIQTVPFDERAAVIYGDIRAHLDAQGTPIGGNDLLIVASALAYDLIIVTHNTREFGRVPNIKYGRLGGVRQRLLTGAVRVKVEEQT